MKVAYVSVRYGPTIPGGAEQACRQLAEHLAAEPGVEVEVHTTCATDSRTWADDSLAGTTVEGGVVVHRYRSASGRDPSFDAQSGPVLADPAHQSSSAQQEWLHRQGPVSPDLVDGAVSSGADLVVCTPYLYWPTVETAGRVPDRLVLHPAAHDEAPIRLPVFASVFAAARGLAFYTDAERRLVERLWPSLAGTPQLVTGLGLDGGPTVTTDGFRSTSGIGDRPYLVVFGRVDDGKGAKVVAEFFAAYKRRRPGPLALVFAGPVIHPPAPHPDIVVTGAVSERDKWAALSGAEVFISPSANESFSIVLLEAWSTGRPALVNGRCPATTEHLRRSGGGLTFSGYAGFEVALDRLLADSATAKTMGEAGRHYVERTFAWPVVTGRYRRWLERLVETPVR